MQVHTVGQFAALHAAPIQPKTTFGLSALPRNPGTPGDSFSRLPTPESFAYANSIPNPPLPTYGIIVEDPEIIQALRVLENTTNLPEDEAYLKAMGVNILFHSGKEAIELLRKYNVRVVFDSLNDPTAHAIWVRNENKIVVNARYRGNFNPAIANAVASSIYHEAGHVTALGDNQSSIQEEIDCLALNVLAFKAHVAKDPSYLRMISVEPLKGLFDSGVALYPKLFFDPNPFKTQLINRIIEKYGMLPPDSPDHTIPHLANNKTLTERVLHEIQRRNAQIIY